MKAHFNRLFKLTVGWMLLLLGIIGWLLPVVPGTPFVLVGVAILSAQSEWLRHKIEGLRIPARLRLLRQFLAAKIRRVGAS